MRTYVGSMSFTEEGKQTIKEATKRAIAGSAGVCRGAIVAGVLAFSGGNIAFALDTCLSGFEVSPGTDVAGLTQGVTFAGIDNLPYKDGGPDPTACDRWTTDGNGGSWTAKIDRVGAAGIGGGGVTVVGGRWYWLDRDDHLHFGRVESELGPEYEVLLDLLASEREAARAAGKSTETLDWQRALDSDMLDLIRAGEITTARERLQACLSSS